jgi:hypothetical protein
MGLVSHNLVFYEEIIAIILRKFGQPTLDELFWEVCVFICKLGSSVFLNVSITLPNRMLCSCQ